MILENFYTYAEMCKLFYERFKATPDEVRYWVKGTSEQRKRNHTASYLQQLRRYKSDIPFFVPDDEYLFSHLMNRRFIDIDEEEDCPQSFFPEYNYYLREEVESFMPHIARFVYVKDLPTKRNWLDYKIDDKRTQINDTLKKASEVGILRFYDKDIDDFTLTQPRYDASAGVYKKVSWLDTTKGTDYLSNPDSFFLLFDIITIERQFFDKPRELCFKELFPDTEFKEENNAGKEEEKARQRISEAIEIGYY